MSKITEEMEKETKRLLLEIQLKNAVNLLNGTLVKKTLSDYKGKVQKQIVITYDEDESFD